MRWIIVSLFIVAPNIFAQDYEEIGPAWVFKTDQTFVDAKDNLTFAIEGRGLVISYISHASSMLERTADAVEDTGLVYADAEIILFCKADLSHAMVKHNPHYLTLCPYSIAVYTLADDTDHAYISMPRPFSDEPILQPITELLVTIIREAADGF